MEKEKQSGMNDLEKRQECFPEEPNRSKEIWEWLKEGFAAGFISDVYCQNHDAFAMEDSDEFSELFEEADGSDFCWSVVNIKWEKQ
tara:strand:- start:894 stop:1151 length:258 start_codon:yes stop_codon:yes gene_type:complete